MPNYPQPADAWLQNKLGSIADAGTIAGKQITRYVIDPKGVCQAIIGNLEHTHTGEATGLTGWGIALLNAGKWVGPVASEPPKAAEGSVSVGTIGFDRTVTANLVGNGVLKVFAVPHPLGTKSVTVTVHSEAGEEIRVVTLVKKISTPNAREVELEFETAPAKGVVYWVKISG